MKVDRSAMDDWRFRSSALNLGFPDVLNIYIYIYIFMYNDIAVYVVGNLVYRFNLIQSMQA